MKRFLVLPLTALLIVGAAFAARRAYAHHLPAVASAATADDLFAELPTANSPAAMYIDMKALRTSPFVSKIAAMIPETKKDADYLAFVNATGFHYETDLDQIALVTDPSIPGNSAQIVAQGNFDEQKIAAYAQAKGKLTAKSGTHVYQFTTDNPGNTVTMEFLSPNRLRVVSTNTNKGSAPTNGNAAAPPIPMREHISRVSGAALFGVFHVNGMKDMNAQNSGPMASTQMAQIGRSVEWVSLTGNPESNDLRISIEAECDSAPSAQQLASGLTTLKAMAPMFLNQAAAQPQNGQPQMPPEVSAALTQLISSLQISSDDTHAKLSMLFTQQIIDALSKAAKSRTSATD